VQLAFVRDDRVHRWKALRQIYSKQPLVELENSWSGYAIALYDICVVLVGDLSPDSKPFEVRSVYCDEIRQSAVLESFPQRQRDGPS
jgi:hypothetical protein